MCGKTHNQLTHEISKILYCCVDCTLFIVGSHITPGFTIAESHKHVCLNADFSVQAGSIVIARNRNRKGQRKRKATEKKIAQQNFPIHVLQIS